MDDFTHLRKVLPPRLSAAIRSVESLGIIWRLQRRPEGSKYQHPGCLSCRLDQGWHRFKSNDGHQNFSSVGTISVRLLVVHFDGSTECKILLRLCAGWDTPSCESCWEVSESYFFSMRIVVSDPLPSLADVVEAIQRADTVQGNR